MQVEFSLATAGYCLAGQHHALRGTSRKEIRFYATFGIIRHPRHGVILFDTGYTQRFYEQTARFPANIYAAITKVHIRPEEEAKEVLRRQGITAEEVRYIIISHFHADHIGGLRDFPNARFICAENAYRHYLKSEGILAFRKGYLYNLLPADFARRVDFIEFENKGAKHPQLDRTVDYFGDGSILFCRLEGHARGQIGAILNTAAEPVFLIADACWLRETYRNNHLPHPVVRVFFDSWSAFKNSIRKVRAFHAAFPQATVIPCHCEATYRNSEYKIEPLS